MSIKDPPNVLPFKENNPSPKVNLRDAAEKWIEGNPSGYRLFVKFAMQMLGRRRNFGIGQLTERVRWEVALTWERDPRGFKINNNHRAYIARKLVEDYPRLEPFIQFRKTFW